jgi:hypothetical protein
MTPDVAALCEEAMRETSINMGGGMLTYSTRVAF